MRKPLAFKKCDGRTDGPTDTARCRVACPRLKSVAVRGSDETPVRAPEALVLNLELL